MNVISYNTSWMTFNIFLAIIPVVAGWLFLIEKNRLFKFIYGIIWFTFLPNTIYVFTDLIHFIQEWVTVGSVEKIVITVQYILLVFMGFVTFILAFYPFERWILASKWKKSGILFCIIINLFMGFGIVLGRIERINSWDIFFSPTKVLQATVTIFDSFEKTVLVILFGLFVNFSYFLFKDPIIKYCSKVMKKFGI